MDTTRTILLLDGDEQSARDIQRFLKVSAFTFAIHHVTDVQEGTNYLKNKRPDIVLLDMNILQQPDFEQFNGLVKKEDIPLILLGNHNTNETRRAAEAAGAKDYLDKDKINLFHLQKAILNTLEITETQHGQNQSAANFQRAEESLRRVLEKTGQGILIIDQHNAILYASTAAYGIMGNSELHARLTTYLNYRIRADEEIIELRTSKISVRLQVSESDWLGEKSNLFILEKTNVSIENAGIFKDVTLPAFLDSLGQGFLIMRDEKIVFANRSALGKLNLKSTEVGQVLLTDFFDGAEALQGPGSIHDFMNGREIVLSLKQADAMLKKASAFVKPVMMGDKLYQLLSFEILETAKENKDGNRFTPQGFLELASHDLREPVRTILNYIQLVSDNLQKEKYDVAGEYAGYARAAASRMEALLSDLKTFVRLSDEQFAPGKVKARQLVNDVLKSLKARIEETGAEINVAELPEVIADRELAEKLFYNLIDNAIKFQKKGKQPVIDIGFDKYEGQVLFCVRDNGIGISKKYQDKIFELFERLNRIDEFPGNGLGLALCKRIVEMHGGKIWVESLPGFGSSFYFTLGGK